MSNFSINPLQRWACWTYKSDLGSTTKCDQNHISHICKLVTLKALTKHEHLFNEPALEASSLNKISCLAPALGVSKYTIDIDVILITLFVLLKSDLDVQQIPNSMNFDEYNLQAPTLRWKSVFFRWTEKINFFLKILFFGDTRPN